MHKYVSYHESKTEKLINIIKSYLIQKEIHINFYWVSLL